MPRSIIMDNNDRKEVDDIVKDIVDCLMIGGAPNVIRDNGDDPCCDQVFPNIFLGGIDAAKNKKYLKRLGITHVVNTAMGDSCGQVDTNASFYAGTKISFLGFRMMDYVNVDISQHFNEAADFIDQGLNSGGKVFVHCFMGISRSSTIVCAFLMLKRGFSAVEAIRLVRSRRVIYPNPGFQRRLAVLDLKLRKERENRDRQQRVILWGTRDRPSSSERPSSNYPRSNYDRRSSYDHLSDYLISLDRLGSYSRPYDHSRDCTYDRLFGHERISSYDRRTSESDLRPVRAVHLNTLPSPWSRENDISRRIRWAGSLPTSYLLSLRRN